MGLVATTLILGGILACATAALARSVGFTEEAKTTLGGILAGSLLPFAFAALVGLWSPAGDLNVASGAALITAFAAVLLTLASVGDGGYPLAEQALLSREDLEAPSLAVCVWVALGVAVAMLEGSM